MPLSLGRISTLVFLVLLATGVPCRGEAPLPTVDVHQSPPSVHGTPQWPELTGDITLSPALNKPSICYVILYPKEKVQFADVIPKLHCRELTLEELAILAHPQTRTKE